MVPTAPAALLVLAAVLAVPAVAAADLRPVGEARAPGRGEEARDARPGWLDRLDPFRGRGARKAGPPRPSCPEGSRSCCCGGRCTCKEECSFAPCAPP